MTSRPFASPARRLRVAADFDFVRGGKLPGLAGGAANTGGKTPNGEDLSWSIGGQRVFRLDQFLIGTGSIDGRASP